MTATVPTVQQVLDRDLPLDYQGDRPLVREVEVTPDMASYWLERCNTDNYRALDQRVVSRYARDMQHGAWVDLNGATLVFDRNGHLADGQHRLAAAVQADHTFRTLVLVGAQPEATLTMDDGKKRTMANILKNRGEVNTAVLAATLNLLWRFERQGTLQRTRTAPPSKTDLLQTLDRHLGVRDAIRVSRHYKVPGLTASVSAVVYYLTQRVDTEDSDFFFARLADGVGLEVGDPIYAGRQWFIRAADAGPGRRPTPNIQAAVLTKTWTKFRRGEDARQIGWRPGGSVREPFPYLDGADFLIMGIDGDE